MRNALKGEGLRYSTGRIPGAVFTDPDVASVGMTADEAQAASRRVKVGRQPMRARGQGTRHG